MIVFAWDAGTCCVEGLHGVMGWNGSERADVMARKAEVMERAQVMQQHAAMRYVRVLRGSQPQTALAHVVLEANLWCQSGSARQELIEED